MYDLLAYNDGYSSKSRSICVFFYRDKTLHKKKRFSKICETERKDQIFVSFRMFPFHGNGMGQLFVEDIYIFSIISRSKRDRVIEDLFCSPPW